MTATRNASRSARTRTAGATSNAKTSPENAQAKVRASIAIFTRNSAKIQAMLFLNTSTHERAPLFGGSISGTKVSAFLRHPGGDKQPFLSFVDGANEQIATANVRVREADGVPVLNVLYGKQGDEKTSTWFNLSKNVSDAMLERMGCNMERLHKKAAKEAVPA